MLVGNLVAQWENKSIIHHCENIQSCRHVRSRKNHRSGDNSPRRHNPLTAGPDYIRFLLLINTLTTSV